MTIPRNFIGRKATRRASALERMYAQLKEYKAQHPREWETIRKGDVVIQSTGDKIKKLEAAIKRTEEKLSANPGPVFTKRLVALVGTRKKGGK